MGNLRKIVGVGIAVAIVAALAVYVLIPKTGPTANNIAVTEPQNPASPTSGGTTSGTGSGPTPSTPPARPPKAHGELSHGPKQVICLPDKNHDGNGVSQYQGANQYRGQCPTGSPNGALDHGLQLAAEVVAAAVPAFLRLALP